MRTVIGINGACGRMGQRLVCLAREDATVAYHSTDREKFDAYLGARGVKRASYANRAVQVPNVLNEIIRAIEVYS